MCTSPSFVWVQRGPKWEQTPVPCDRCWSCRENYINDWVGRCLCEASTSVSTGVFSLTYATPKDRREMSHRIVNPHHFQLFMKRLRKAGHKVRYLVAGEYGDLRDRAHFHVILFFKHFAQPQGAPVPKLENRAAFLADPSIAAPLHRQMPNKDMCHIREWPYGHVEADWSMSEEAVRYCCQYLYKDGKRTAWLSMSKKPPLGYEWFMSKAALTRDLGVLPSSFEYLPPGGKPGKVYLMTGATRREYLNAVTKDRRLRPRMSEWVAKTFDKLERAEAIEALTPSFNDEAFLGRQEPVEKVVKRLAWDDVMAPYLAERADKAIALAEGFADVEEWKAFKDSGGWDTNPSYVPTVADRPEHLSCEPVHRSTGLCPCRRCADLRDRAAAIRARKPEPTSFDRTGKPVYGDWRKPPLASVYDRKGTAQAGRADLPEGPAEE